MPLTGFAYLVFVLVALAGHTLLARREGLRKAWLTVCSLYFYMTVDWRFAGLILALAVSNHAAGTIISASTRRHVRRLALAAALLVSLGILFYFKYFGFFAASANAVMGRLGMTASFPVVEVILPVGISFLTFQAMTYPLDLYLRRLHAPCRLSDFLLFLAFFPRLLSGPIVRAAYFVPQLAGAPPGESDQRRVEGLLLILRGLIKKVLLADTLGVGVVDAVFADPSAHAAGEVFVATVAYSLQVYLDLSGYTDMAIGVARLFGYQLPGNFNRPYLATSIANFWQRWHITMSSFFRDYLYAGLQQAMPRGVYGNLILVFVAIGLWHGAGWNFVAYGAIHGALVGWEHWRGRRAARRGMRVEVARGWRRARQILSVFLVVALTRVLFRCSTVDDALTLYGAMLNVGDTTMPAFGAAVWTALCAGILLHVTPVAWRDGLMQRAAQWPGWALGGLFVVVLYAVVAFGPGRGGFIYYQF